MGFGTMMYGDLCPSLREKIPFVLWNNANLAFFGLVFLRLLGYIKNVIGFPFFFSAQIPPKSLLLC